jgi:hypothetical protein
MKKQSLLTNVLAIGFVSISSMTLGQTQPTQPTTPAVTTEKVVTLGDQVTMKVGGFLKSDVFYDSRKPVDIIDGLFLFYPTNESKDAAGKDMNAVPLMRMSALTSRLSTKFTGPDVMNAKTSSLVEFDFSGVNGIGLRLRHAWLKLNWANKEFLMGRYWHPLFLTEAFPTVLALNTGAPFAAFNRAEQMRFTYSSGKLSTFIAACVQMDYGFPSEYDAASGKTSYLHNSVMPDISGNIQYKSDMLLFGATGNYKINQPRLSTKKGTASYQQTTTIGSYALQGYAQVKTNNLKIKGSVMYGQNMNEYLILGGYAVKSADTATTNNEKYTPVNYMYYWGNILYGKDLQLGLFLGYAQNLGTTAKTLPTYTKFYGRAKEETIGNLLRIAPSISYKAGRMQFMAEIEHTIAAYGTPNLANHGRVINSKKMSVTRVQFSTFFYF